MFPVIEIIAKIVVRALLLKKRVITRKTYRSPLSLGYFPLLRTRDNHQDLQHLIIRIEKVFFFFFSQAKHMSDPYQDDL